MIHKWASELSCLSSFQRSVQMRRPSSRVARLDGVRMLRQELATSQPCSYCCSQAERHYILDNVTAENGGILAFPSAIMVVAVLKTNSHCYCYAILVTFRRWLTRDPCHSG